MKNIQSIDVFLNIQGCAEFIELARLGMQLSESHDVDATTLGAKVLTACGAIADSVQAQIDACAVHKDDDKPAET